MNNQGIKKGVNKSVKKGVNKGVNKDVKKVVEGDIREGVVGSVVGGVDDLRANIVHSNVIRIIDDYKPFLDLKYHFLFDSFPSNHIPFVHFLIFLIWFASPFHFPIQLFDLFSLFLHFKTFPFHSCLFHIKLISGNNG